MSSTPNSSLSSTWYVPVPPDQIRSDLIVALFANPFLFNFLCGKISPAKLCVIVFGFCSNRMPFSEMLSTKTPGRFEKCYPKTPSAEVSWKLRLHFIRRILRKLPIRSLHQNFKFRNSLVWYIHPTGIRAYSSPVSQQHIQQHRSLILPLFDTSTL